MHFPFNNDQFTKYITTFVAGNNYIIINTIKQTNLYSKIETTYHLFRQN